jgi:hypothetical protein
MTLQYSTATPPEINGLILIDCWEPQPQEINKQGFFNYLAESLHSVMSTGNVKQVINASRQLRMNYEDRSIVNTLQRYIWDYIIDFENIHTPNYYNTWILFNTLSQFRSNYTTSSWIRESVLNNDVSFYVVSAEDFLAHWHAIGNSSKATEWLVVGQSWQNCVHKNAIGLFKLAEIAEHYRMNFYVRSDLVITEQDETLSDSDFENDSLHWIKFQDTNLYQLINTK